MAAEVNKWTEWGEKERVNVIRQATAFGGVGSRTNLSDISPSEIWYSAYYGWPRKSIYCCIVALWERFCQGQFLSQKSLPLWKIYVISKIPCRFRDGVPIKKCRAVLHTVQCFKRPCESIYEDRGSGTAAVSGGKERTQCLMGKWNVDAAGAEGREIRRWNASQWTGLLLLIATQKIPIARVLSTKS